MDGLERRGTGYAAVWDLSSMPSIRKYFRLIRQATANRDWHTADMTLESFDKKLERVFNDQTVPDNDFQPLTVVKSKNKVVNDGLVRIAELATGSVGLNSSTSGSGYFTHFAAGSGSNPVSASDYALQQEVARVGLGSDGFQTAAGSIMRFGGFFAPTIASCTVTEAGVFDDPNAGVMLFRTIYSGNAIVNHTVNADYFTLSHSIYQNSV
jgi:hypothetical protein